MDVGTGNENRLFRVAWGNLQTECFLWKVKTCVGMSRFLPILKNILKPEKSDSLISGGFYSVVVFNTCNCEQKVSKFGLLSINVLILSSSILVGLSLWSWSSRYK